MTNDIWIVDDEPTICRALKKILEREGFRVSVFSSAQPFIDALAFTASRPKAILLDIRLPGKSGLDLLTELHSQTVSIPIILMTAFGDLKTAVDAVRGKAFEYLTKPFDLDEVLQAVHRAVRIDHQRTYSASKQSALRLEQQKILGQSPSMQQIYKQVASAAESDLPVLIEGEQGTGKSLVASMIHRLSRRSTDPYLVYRVSLDRQSDDVVQLW